MIDTISDERRTKVRGGISFKVKFQILSPEEYHNVDKSNMDIFSPNVRKKGIDITDMGNKDAALNASLMDFLLYLDDKLDQILTFVSRDMPNKESPNQGIGSNISGSGMNMITETPLESGKIIRANFVLSRFPFVFIDVFGEIIWVTPVDEDGKTWYQLGINFLDLNIKDREKIIACVFQRERETLREQKH
jgi:hypothetical protein